MLSKKWSADLVDVDTLELIFAAVIRDLRSLEIPKVALTKDYYWDFVGDQFDVSNEPELGFGQLHDDWEMLHNHVMDEDSMLTSIDLEALSAILGFLSFKTVMSGYDLKEDLQSKTAS